MHRTARILAFAAVAAPVSTGFAQAEPLSFPGADAAPYVRLEAGAYNTSFGGAYWLPPGYPTDPRIDFDLDGESGGMAGVAFGLDWQNGLRADLGVLGLAKADVTGLHTTPGDHADITGGSVSTRALMASVFYAPMEQRGIASAVQPFVVAGIGLARNRVGEWTRTNLTEERTDRTFEGASSTDLALSVGVGAAIEVAQNGKHPVTLEIAYRYYDFGTAQGGSTPLPEMGESEPVEPLTFQNRDSVVSLSLRIPLQRR